MPATQSTSKMLSLYVFIFVCFCSTGMLQITQKDGYYETRSTREAIFAQSIFLMISWSSAICFFIYEIKDPARYTWAFLIASLAAWAGVAIFQVLEWVFSYLDDIEMPDKDTLVPDIRLSIFLFVFGLRGGAYLSTTWPAMKINCWAKKLFNSSKLFKFGFTAITGLQCVLHSRNFLLGLLNKLPDPTSLNDPVKFAGFSRHYFLWTIGFLSMLNACVTIKQQVELVSVAIGAAVLNIFVPYMISPIDTIVPADTDGHRHALRRVFWAYCIWVSIVLGALHLKQHLDEGAVKFVESKWQDLERYLDRIRQMFDGTANEAEED